jgi:nitrate reductase gamma subunit
VNAQVLAGGVVWAVRRLEAPNVAVLSAPGEWVVLVYVTRAGLLGCSRASLVRHSPARAHEDLMALLGLSAGEHAGVVAACAVDVPAS